MNRFKIFAALLSLPIVILLLLMPFSPVEAGVAYDLEGVSTIAELLADRDEDGQPDRLGERVTARGRATIGTGVFHENYVIIYMQDATAGIMVYSDSLDVTIERGDSLHVTGKLALHSSKPEIVVDHLEVVGEDKFIPDPEPLSSVFDEPERYRGMLVSGEAIVDRGDYGSSRKMLKITPVNGTEDSLHIFVSRSNIHYENFKFDVLEKGDRIYIRGILIRYTSGYTGKTYYQVLPRRQEDLRISGLRPTLEEGSFIYADIDTARRQIYVLLESGLWKYDLTNERWHFLDALEGFPAQFKEYEFGFNQHSGNLELWSRGIGELYTIDPETFRVKRIDRSFDHRNMYGHYPFYRGDTLYAFGGYGFWEWHNIMLFYNRSLNEWSIQNVDMESSFPSQRVAGTGVYVEGSDRLFIFGGSGTKSGHPDDQNAVNQVFRDIWAFSFSERKWEKVMTLDLSSKGATGDILPDKVGSINKLSSSFYLPGEQLWFIPSVESERLDDKFFLKPVHLPNRYTNAAISLNFGSSNEFIPTNYLYSADDQEAVFVGINNLSNTDMYPVRIIRMPSDSLMARIDDVPFYASIPWYYYLVGLVFIGGFLLWMYRDRLTGSGREEKQPVTFSTLKQDDWLNCQEKDLLNYMHEQKRFMDAHEIEELLWSDVESYDYRRRLRNDTINSLNRKFQKHYPGMGRLIVRKKDPDDNRRYLYGLNKDLM